MNIGLHEQGLGNGDVRKCSIGIDIGTTSVKAVAMNEQGKELARAAGVVKTEVDASGKAEQDPWHVFELVQTALAGVTREVHAAGYTVALIGLSSAMHSIMAVDSADEPLTPALTWMDSRAFQEAEDLWNRPQGPTIYARTGTPIHAMTPLVKLLWLKKTRPELLSEARKFVSLKEWVWFQWFGEWCVDEGMATAMGLYSLKERAWDEEALACAGIERDLLSQVVSTTYWRDGVHSTQLTDAGIATSTRFCIGASDGVLANLGVGAVNQEAMVLTVGTSCAVRMGSTKIATDRDTRSFCYILDTDHFVVGGPSNSGGVVLEWVHQQVSGQLSGQQKVNQDDFLQLIMKASGVEDDGLFCLPYLSGERAPLWNAKAKAAFIGLQMYHTPEYLMRAALEGVLLNAYWIADSLFERLGRSEKIVTSGKLLGIPWIRQLVADIFGMPVQCQADIDASVFGAVALAHVATGQWSYDEAIARGRRNLETGWVHPHPQRVAAYHKKFEQYKKLALTLTPMLS